MTYTEDNLTEQPAIKLFESLGWQTLNCYSENFGEDGLLGRENRSEVVLVRELRQTLVKIIPECTANEIKLVIEEINRDRSVMSDIAVNQSCYQLLKEGVKVEGVYHLNLGVGSKHLFSNLV